MSRLSRTAVVAVLLAAVFSFGGVPLASAQSAEPKVSVYFSPKGGCTEAVVAVLGQAKQTVLVQAYSFTSAPIAKALVDAFKRGVKVQVSAPFSIGLEHSRQAFLQTCDLRVVKPGHPVEQAVNQVLVRLCLRCESGTFLPADPFPSSLNGDHAFGECHTCIPSRALGTIRAQAGVLGPSTRSPVA